MPPLAAEIPRITSFQFVLILTAIATSVPSDTIIVTPSSTEQTLAFIFTSSCLWSCIYF
jgi:hypothetical protein